MLVYAEEKKIKYKYAIWLVNIDLNDHFVITN